MSELALPSEDEIARLPRWARVALAARCARRVLPLFARHEAAVPAEHAGAVNRAVEGAERASAADDLARGAAPALAAAARAACSAAADAVAADVARAAAAAAASVAASGASAVAATILAIESAVSAARVLISPAIRADFDALARAAHTGQWTDDTPVPPTVFGPLWPGGAPAGWPVGSGSDFAAENSISTRSASRASDSTPAEVPHRHPSSPGGRPTFEPGDKVPNAELWVLEEKLGAGGFGEVWRARNRASNEFRAVKFCTQPVARDRLVTHESKVALHVRKHMSDPSGCHPNIVPLLECNLTGEPPWLMYEYVAGGRSLVDVIEELGFRPAAERIARAIGLMHIIAGAVGRFHRIHVPIVHRDLKHRNVLMDGDTPRIADFGIGGAAVLGAIADATGAFTDYTVALPSLLKASGTPPHASPQQARGAPPHPRDDVYALGVMAYQLLVGRADAKVQGYWHKRLKEAEVPEVLIDLIGHSTSEEPEDRPLDATVWERALAPLLPDAPEPDAPAVPTFTIAVPGVWFSRPGTNPSADWERVAFTPGAVAFTPDQEFSFRVNEAITDHDLEVIEELAAVPQFTDLDLTNCTDLTDAGLAHLQPLEGLQQLELTGCRQITSKGLSHLRRLTNLRALDLSGCVQITDSGLAYLRELKSLRSLHLDGCVRITNAGVEHLRGLKNLRALHLVGCAQFTGAGLAHLSGLKGLRVLDLRDCKRITQQRIAALNKVLPNCEIQHSLRSSPSEERDE